MSPEFSQKSFKIFYEIFKKFLQIIQNFRQNTTKSFRNWAKICPEIFKGFLKITQNFPKTLLKPSLKSTISHRFCGIWTWHTECTQMRTVISWIDQRLPMCASRVEYLHDRRRQAEVGKIIEEKNRITDLDPTVQYTNFQFNLRFTFLSFSHK